MTKAKKSLTLSSLALFLCIAMLIGTTFAWFTDTVQSGKNTITAGNLDVELYHQDKALAQAEKVTGETELFDDVTLWEPGAYAYETFTVKNEGNLALKYAMNLVAENPTVVGEHSLDEVLQVKVVNPAPTERPSYTDGTALKGWSLGYDNKPLYPADSGDGKKSEETFTVVVFWNPTDNDNTWNMNNDNKNQTLSVDLGVDLYATQFMSEEDSFGSDYDNLEFAGNQPGIQDIFEAMTKKYEEGTAGTLVPSEIIVQEPINIDAVEVKKSGDPEPQNYAAEIDGATTTINLMNTMTATGNDRYDIDAAMRIQGQSGRQSVVTFKGNENGKFTNVGSGLHSLIYLEGESIVNFESGTFETIDRIITANLFGSEKNTQQINVSGGTFIFNGKNKSNPATFTNNFIKGPFNGSITITGGTFYNCDPSAYVNKTEYKVDSKTVGNDIIYTVVAN